MDKAEIKIEIQNPESESEHSLTIIFKDRKIFERLGISDPDMLKKVDANDIHFLGIVRAEALIQMQCWVSDSINSYVRDQIINFIESMEPSDDDKEPTIN